MKKKLPIFLTLVFIFFFLLLISKFTNKSSAAPSTHLVISEVQVSSISSSSADFIEIYNPTNNDINLGSLRLVKRTSSGTTDTNIAAFTNAHIVPSHGFFLWCNSDHSIEYNCDYSTSATIANNNSIALRNDPVNTGIIIDALTIGSVANSLGEGTNLNELDNSKSYERKAKSSSNNESMQNEDINLGNSEDTDNNANDFVLKNVPHPQNSQSVKEELIDPTNSPSPIPTVTINPTNQPTSTPSASPTLTNTPTPTLTISLTPTATPTPTVNQIIAVFPLMQRVCILERTYIFSGIFKLIFPKLICKNNL